MSDSVKAPSALQRDELSALIRKLGKGKRRRAPQEPDLRRLGRGEGPLSFAQERLWLLDQLDPGGSVYNVPVAVDLSGELESAALAAALAEIVRRHEALRTTFRKASGKPVQVIASPAAAVLPTVDLRRLNGPHRQRIARRLERAVARRPFDLERGPLLRALLLRLAGDRHVLVLVLHHIVADGWTTGVLIRELSALYGARRGGAPAALPELPIQVADFAVWQRAWIEGEAARRHMAYWKKQLDGLPVLELPTDRPRPPIETSVGSRRPVTLGAAASAGARQLARHPGTTLFMTLLAVFQAVLQRMSGQEELAVGSPIANRGRVETENLAGCFTNTLVLRARMPRRLTFSEHLERVREATLDAYAHQDTPFEKLIEALAPVRDPSRNPLFQVVLALQNAPQPELRLPGLTLGMRDVDTGTAKFDLTLVLWEEGDRLAGTLEHNAALFDATTARRFLGRVEHLLEQTAADPERPLSSYQVLRAAERHQVAWEWNDAPRPDAAPGPVHRWFDTAAERDPRAVAVTCDGEQLRYGELRRRSNRLAHLLARRGVAPEVLVGLALERTPDMVMAILAVLKTGGAYVPLDPSYPAQRLALLVEDSAVALLVTESHLLPRLTQAAAPKVCLDREHEALAAERDDDPGVAVAPESLAYVIYTSGSTGKPKGVQVSHGNVSRLLAATEASFGFGPGDVWTLFHSYAFDFSVWEIWGALCTGGRLVVVPYWVSREPEAFRELLAREQVTVLNQTPSAFRQLIQADAKADPTPPLALSWVIFGGEALELESLRPWLAAHGDRRPRLVNMYGITETTVHVTERFLSWADLGGGRGSVIGQAIADLEMVLLGGDLRPVPIGVPGEIFVGGAGVSRGYLGRPGLTAERFLPDPFSGRAGARLYRSGDLARSRPDGDVEHLGRIDHQVQIRGFRIELGEIESALAQSPGVGDAAVLALPDPSGSDRLVAFAVLGEGTGGDSVRRTLREKLPEHMVPSLLVPLEALPINANGKLDRAALSRLAAAEPEVGSGEDHVAPRGPLEEALAKMWSDLLGIERVGVHDSFFELGGHSLLATQLISRVSDAFRVRLSLRQLFESSTLEELARAIAAAEAAPDPGTIRPRRDPEERPLTYAQQRLWFLEQLEPGSATYNIAAALRLTGHLDTAALTAALDEVTARHESLRTTFGEERGQPVLRVVESRRTALPLIDLGALPAAVRDAETRRLARGNARRPFDLGSGPLLRLILLRLDAEPVEQEHALLFAMHHIVSDGWSIGVLVREIAALYGARRRGEPGALPALPIQMPDVAVWQRRQLAGEALEAQLAWWRERLAGSPPLLELPGDRPRPAVASLAGAVCRWRLSAEASRRLEGLGEEAHATRFMTLLAAFKVLLLRLTGQRDVSVGSPVAGRDGREVEGLIGLFVNTVVLRTDLGGDPTFPELLARVWETTVGAHAHQDLPFERLVEELQPTRDRSVTPLFQVMFAQQNAPLASQQLPGLSMTPMEVDSGTAKFDLTLALEETAAGLGGSLEYSHDLFDATTVRRWLGHFTTLVKGIVAAPGRRLSQLPLLSAAERSQLLAQWNDTAAAFPETATLHGLFAAQAARTPEATAVVCGEHSVSYRELAERVCRLAAQLRRLGVGPEATVGVCLERSIELVVALYGALEAGGAYLFLDPGLPEQRLAFMLEDAQVDVVLSHSALRDRLPAGDARVLCLDSDAAPDTTGAVTAAPSAVSAANAAYVIYTSGSTGKPKGVVLSHGAAVNHMLWMQRELGFTAQDRVLQKTPLSFDASVWEIFVPLLSGGRVVMARPGGEKDPAYLLDEIHRREISVLQVVPALLRLLLAQPGLEQHTSLRTVFCGGEALPEAWAAEFRRRQDAALVNLYGPSEAAIDTTFERCAGDGPISVGRPIANARVAVLGPGLRPVPPGALGELCIAGAGLARGYLRRAALTADRFVPDPAGTAVGGRLYRSGDLARWLPDGRLELVGRIDHQVKLRGHRVELGEIEASLAAHPTVRQAAVLVWEGELADDRRLVAYLTAQESNPAAEALRAWLAERLPSYMVPAAFVPLAELPLTRSGKVDRRALPAPDWDTGAAGEGGAPRSPAEEALAAIWSEVLGRREIGIHDSFFALGGHSLLATRVVAGIRETLGVEVPLAALFEKPTVAALAPAVEAGWGASAAPALEPLPRTADGAPRDPVPLSFAQERLWFLDQLEPDSPAYNLPTAVRLAGALNIAALAAGLAGIVRRHEALRTTFGRRGADGDPVQVIAPRLGVRLPLVDLSRLPAGARAAETRRRVGAEVQRPFDLGRGPLLRATLLRTAAEEHALLLTLHHIVSDGWSLGVLIRELAAFYDAASAGRRPALPALPMQVADVAVWQRRWLAGEVLAGELAWWKDHLAGAPAVLELPADRPRRGRARGSRPPGAQERLLLSGELPERLAALARQEGATLFMTLLAVFQALLGRLTGARDVVVGSPIAHRGRSEIEGLIGFFVNTLVLRTDLGAGTDGAEPGFRRLLGRVRRGTLAAYAHQDVPFEKLVEELAPQRDPSHTPLFQVAFALQNLPWAPLELPGLRMTPLELPSTVAKFDLAFVLREAGGALEGWLDYASELFDATTVRRLLRGFTVLAEGAAGAPDRPLSELPLLAASERQQLLREWNDKASGYPRESCLQQLFEARVARHPRAVAVVGDDGELTYGELNRRANRLAHRLIELGVGPEVPVGIALERSVAFVEAVLGIVKAGGVYVPLDPAYPAERLAFMAEDAGLQVVVSRAGQAGELPADGVERLLLDADREDAARPSDSDPPCRGWPEARVYVIYTSGSTGRPKGISVAHRAVARLVLDTDYVDLGPADRVAHASNTAFDAATFEIWGALLTGATLVVIPPQLALSPKDFAHRLAERRVTTLFVTTALFNEVLRQVPDAFGSLETVLFGGEAVDPQWVRRCLETAPPSRLLHVYGPTESTTFATWQRVEKVAPGAATLPIGTAIAASTIHVVDRHLRPVPAGVAGELVIGADGLARGYLGRPARTAGSFVPDPFAAVAGERLYRTGDLVRQLAGGAVEFVGRIDHQVKLRGFRIELGEIEARLSTHRQVREAVVLVRRDGGDRKLVAFLVAENGEALPTTDELRGLLRAKLPEYMVPAAFAELPEMPLNPNGKVDRGALGRVDLPERADVSVTAPRNPVEEVLAGIWAEVLGRDAVGVDDSFFELGGHSLLATRAIGRVRRVFGPEVDLGSLFEAPTVAGFAAHLAAQGLATVHGAAALEPIAAVARQPGEELPLSFAQERLWFLDRLEPGSTSLNISAPVRLTGILDAGALRAAISGVARRHEVLRASFGDRGGRPFQRLAPRLDIELPLFDLRRLGGAARREADRRRRQLAAIPFDLERGPLLRAALLRLTEGEHLLLLEVHHIVSDGWSMAILFREVAALYGALAAGAAPPLAQLEVSYADFAAWQRKWFDSGALERQRAYWREHLDGELPVLELPTDRPRPPVQTFTGGSRSLVLEEALGDRLQALSRGCGATLFMTLLAAFNVLLGRLAGQRDVLVGAPIAGRTRAETEELIGIFLNTVVLRADLSGNPPFRELIERVRQASLAAYAHQDVPFEQVLEDVAPARDLSRTPIFQVFFNMLEMTLDDAEMPGLTVEPLHQPEVPSKFDLTAYVRRQGERIHLDLVYNADLFDARRIAELLAQYEHLLRQAAAAPERPIDALDLLTESARPLLPEPGQALDATWRGAVHEIFARLAAQDPERLAVADRDDSATYGELREITRRLAGRLVADGVARGDRVVIYAHRSAPLVAAILGTLEAGAAFVVLDPAYPAARLAEIVEKAAPRGWLALERAGEPPEQLAEALTRLRPCCHLTLPARLGELAATLPATALPAVPLSPHDLAYVAFTSGSTGEPKGICGRHGSLSHFVPWQCEALGFSAEDRFSLLSGLAHDPLQRDIFTPLQIGASVVIPDPAQMMRPGWIAEWVAREQITVAHLTPAMGQLLAESSAGAAPAQMPTLRRAFFVGDVLTRRDTSRLSKQAPELAVVNYFGSTETQRAVGYHRVNPDGDGPEVLPLGQGIPDVQLLVLGRGGGLAGIGEVGEIAVRSPHVSLGYLGDPALTADRFVPSASGTGERMYRTGDLGRYLPDGEVVFVGRADQQVKVRGVRIELGEVESVLGRHAGLAEAVAGVRPGPRGETALVAWVVAASEPAPTADELRSFLGQRLPQQMVPAAFVTLEALPLTPNGKVDRRRLPAPALAGPGAASAPPSSELEKRLAAVWCEVLGLEQLGVDDNFFDLGGHSLLLVRLQRRLEEELGRELPLMGLFRYPNVRALAEHLEAPASEESGRVQVKSRAQRQIEAAKRQRRRRRVPSRPGS